MDENTRQAADERSQAKPIRTLLQKYTQGSVLPRTPGSNKAEISHEETIVRVIERIWTISNQQINLKQ